MSITHRELDTNDQITFLISKLKEANDLLIAERKRLNDIIASKDAIITSLREEAKRGEASAIIRDENNFRKIDNVLIPLSNAPFKIVELFDKWLALIGKTDINDKVYRDAKGQFQTLLTRNDIIRKTGTQLYRVNLEKLSTLTKAHELGWSTSTFLTPKA